MFKSLINQSFNNAKKENRPALLTYTVAGDNTKKQSLEILKSISKIVSFFAFIFASINIFGGFLVTQRMW